eukprot:538911_1
MLWLTFINENIDRMSILKIRKLCTDVAVKDGELPGKILLDYKKNDILNHIPQDIKDIQWTRYVEKYRQNENMYFSVLQTKQQEFSNEIWTTQTDKQRLESFVNIMSEYNSIINNSNQTQDVSKEPQDLQLKMHKLQNLFRKIEKTLNLSQLMDTWYDIQHGNIKDSEKLKREHQCKLEQYCNMLNIDTDRRNNRSMIIATNWNRKYVANNRLNLSLSIEDLTKTELLNTIHIKLFHQVDAGRRFSLNRRRMLISSIEIQDHHLFQDRIRCRNDLNFLYLCCKQEEYDTEAIYDDLFPHNDGQSNIYSLMKHDIEKYYILKQDISKYIINPLDKEAMNRNLVELDFGERVENWNVKPKFNTVKEEWLENEFFPVEQNVYESIYIKSTIIAKQKTNTASYNLLVGDILCIKMYTDTNELQKNFRMSFRTTSDNNRRSQFIHWATCFNITFTKIEIMNKIFNYNEGICNVTLYHGLSRLFDTKKLVRQFNGVLSTTWEESVATTFAGESGMILQINKSMNNENTNAIHVDWISCHGSEQEVLLINPKVMIQKSMVFLKDPELKAAYLKSILLSTVTEDPGAFKNLAGFFQSQWITTCLENTLSDKEFMKRIKIFSRQQHLNGMTLFEFIFFECGHYQIANYISKYYDKTPHEVFKMIFNTDFFINDNNWITSADRSQTLSTKYQPLSCKLQIVYEYNQSTKDDYTFGTKQAKKILTNTNLLLQNVDQRKLDLSENELTIHINISVKYQHVFADKEKSNIRIWRYQLENLQIAIPNEFNWKINQNTTLSNNELYVSSLHVTNQSCLQCTKYSNNNNFGELKIICKDNMLIDADCSISMNETGAKGAFYESKVNNVIYEIKSKYNGESHDTFGGGAAHPFVLEYVGFEEIKILKNNINKKFPVGFGGGCAKDFKGSNGGDGGGTVLIVCHNLTLKKRGKITANGGDGKSHGGGGSGGSILIIADSTNISQNNRSKKLRVRGGRGEAPGRSGTYGVIQFGNIDRTNGAVTFSHKFTETNSSDVKDS